MKTKKEDKEEDGYTEEEKEKEGAEGEVPLKSNIGKMLPHLM